MIKLSTQSLRDFQKRASVIERNTLLPVLANLRFQIDDGVCLATKSSMNAVCIGQIEFEGEGMPDFLLDESVLFYLLGNTTEQWLSVARDGNAFVLSDGKDKVSLPMEPTDNFPVDPEYDQDAQSFVLDLTLERDTDTLKQLTIDDL